MTSRERLLCALNHGQPDRVPVSPDISFMYPAKYSGKPYWEVGMNANPPVWKMTADLARQFEFDAMIQVKSDSSDFEKKIEHSEVIQDLTDYKDVRTTYETPKGTLDKTVRHFAAKSAWQMVPMIKDVEKDCPKLLSILENSNDKTVLKQKKAKEYLGDDGIIGDYIGAPTHYWCNLRGSIQDAILDFYDYPETMDKFITAYTEYALEYVRNSCKQGVADFFMFGGSYASMSVISPDFYRQYNLPFVIKVSEIMKEYGLPICLHMCGHANEMVDVFANETQIDMLEPLERRPGGNITLSEVKKKYGGRLCLKGNVNTFETLASKSAAEVLEEARRCIEDAHEGGGFILSSGDQVPGETPEENFVAMINSAKKYGVYTK